MKNIPPVFLDYVAGLKAHDVDRIGSTMAESLQVFSNGRVLTKAEFLPFLRALYTGFPDWTYDHDPAEWHDDLIAVKWRQSGTHSGVFVFPGLPPIAPTGIAVRIPEQYFRYRVENDKLTELRPDPVPGGAPRGILEQIGVPLPPL
ncbi:MAG: nuclear transport factor 2 family protein [Betaproteobacteria bacterium]